MNSSDESNTELVGIQPWDDGNDVQGVACIVTGSWNGWAKPAFPMDRVSDLVNYLTVCIGLDVVVGDGWISTEDAEDMGEPQVWQNVTIAGVEYATVGAGSWVWEKFTPEGVTA
jgi:hypothetical protein